MDAYNPIFYQVYLLVNKTAMSRESCAPTIHIVTAYMYSNTSVGDFHIRCRQFKFDQKKKTKKLYLLKCLFGLIFELLAYVLNSELSHNVYNYHDMVRLEIS